MSGKQGFFEQLIAEEPSTRQKLFYSAIWLFSQKGYASVGIRELCRSVNVKESAFYNHYDGKEDLFRRILSYFSEQTKLSVFTEDEIRSIVATGDIRLFFERNMQKFGSVAGGMLYHTALQIVVMESFVHPEARDIALHNLYYVRREYTERVLNEMMAAGHIRRCDAGAVTAEYYYGLKGLLDEYLLVENWGGDLDAIKTKIASHIGFFVQMLQK